MIGGPGGPLGPVFGRVLGEVDADHVAIRREAAGDEAGAAAGVEDAGVGRQEGTVAVDQVKNGGMQAAIPPVGRLDSGEATIFVGVHERKRFTASATCSISGSVSSG